MKYEHLDRSWPIDPYRQPPTSTLRPHSAPPAPETFAAHARATVEADGAETWPAGLVEAAAHAIYDPSGDTIRRARRWMLATSAARAVARIEATAALAAIWEWEGE